MEFADLRTGDLHRGRPRGRLRRGHQSTGARPPVGGPTTRDYELLGWLYRVRSSSATPSRAGRLSVAVGDGGRQTAHVHVPLDTTVGRDRGCRQLAVGHVRVVGVPGDGTRLKLTESGFREMAWDAARARCGSTATTPPGGTHFLDRMRALIATLTVGVMRTEGGVVDDELWSAIGDPTRRRMLDLFLADRRRDGDLPQRSVAGHAAGGREAPRRAGPRRTRPRHAAGREKRYRVDEAQFARAEALLQTAAGWDARLRRIKGIAEAIERDRRASQRSTTTTRPRRQTWWTSCTGSASRPPSPDDGLQRADHARGPRGVVDETRGRSGTRAESSSSASRRGGFDMEVVELTPPEAFAWQVVDGPEEWVGTTVDWSSARRVTTRSSCSSTRAGASRGSSCTTAAPSGRPT